MYTKLLVVVWALGFTYILWAPTKNDGEPEQSGLFGYSETEFVAWHPRTESDPLIVPYGAECGSIAMFPVAETRTRYKAPQLTATIVATSWAWFLVGVAWWRRGWKTVGLNPAAH